MKHKALLLSLFLITFTPDFALAETFFDVAAGVRRDDNLGNGNLSPYIFSDTIFTTAVTAGHTLLLNDMDDFLTMKFQFQNESFYRFDGMSNYSAGGSLAYRHKFGLGAFAPWISPVLSFDRLNYVNSVRDGWLQQAGIKGGKRISERLDFWGTFTFDNRLSDHTASVVTGVSGAVFEQKNENLSLNMEYTYTDSMFFTLGYGLRAGDVVVTSLDRRIFNISKAIRPDTAIGSNLFAYRLYGITNIFNPGLGLAINPHCLLSISYQREMTRADGGNNYNKNLFSITGSYNF